MDEIKGLDAIQLESGYKYLFCPHSLKNSILEFGKVPKKDVFPESHKCLFRFNPKLLLTEIYIIENTYNVMMYRSLDNFQNTTPQSILTLVKDNGMHTFVWGVEKIFRDELITELSEVGLFLKGLKNLMITYENKKHKLKELQMVIDHFENVIEDINKIRCY